MLEIKEKIYFIREAIITLYLSDIIPTCCACLRTDARILYEQSIMIFLYPDIFTSFMTRLQVNYLVNF